MELAISDVARQRGAVTANEFQSHRLDRWIGSTGRKRPFPSFSTTSGSTATPATPLPRRSSPTACNWSVVQLQVPPPARHIFCRFGEEPNAMVTTAPRHLRTEPNTRATVAGAPSTGLTATKPEPPLAVAECTTSMRHQQTCCHHSFRRRLLLQDLHVAEGRSGKNSTNLLIRKPLPALAACRATHQIRISYVQGMGCIVTCWSIGCRSLLASPLP